MPVKFKDEDEGKVLSWCEQKWTGLCDQKWNNAVGLLPRGI